jgi:peptidoglycan/LPS O-acetylase OafA/YrhL
MLTSAPAEAGPRAGRDLAPTGVYARAATGFAWIRMVAALVVVIDHSAPLSGTRPNVLPFSWHLSIGHFALMTFFAMSGFQIAESWARKPNAGWFVLKRTLRILPPLVTVLLVAAFVIGPLVTSLPLRSYFADPQTWGYTPNGAGLYGLQHTLPGVFTDNPFPRAVNGSLWTLSMEVTGYALVLVFGLAGLITRFRYLLWFALAGLVLLDTWLHPLVAHLRIVQMPLADTVPFLVAFTIGVVLYAYRDRLPLVPLVAWLLLIGYVAAHFLLAPADRFVLPLAAGYGAIVLAHRWPSSLARFDDWVYGSYGVYIWAFPIQQLLALAGLRTILSLLLVALPLSYLAGLASWFLIERPTLSLRKTWR